MSTNQLTDVNDHAPVFGRQVYEVRVNESAPPETRLVRLKVIEYTVFIGYCD